MALNQSQWYAKLQGFVPAWWFAAQDETPAVFQAIAAVFAQLNLDADDQSGATFLGNATTPILDDEGEERGISRNVSEADSAYRARIRAVTATPDKPDIQAVVNSFMLTGTVTVLDNSDLRIFADRSLYCNRKQVMLDCIINAFSIVVDQQSDTTVYARIVAAVNSMDAFGTTYYFIEILP